MEKANVIVIMLDSLRPDHLGCYGNDWIETPNIDKLAGESVVFANALTAGLPTIPVRTELLTGQFTLPFRPWQPLDRDEITITEILGEYGYTTALIADTYHLFKPGMNFHRGFHAWRWIRGQEADPYRSSPRNVNIDDYVKPAMKGTAEERMIIQYLRNVSRREREEDYFVASVMSEAIEWLRENKDTDRFLLWIDSFDPHEPWDPPSPLDARYTDAKYKGKKLMLPKYGRADWLTQKEIEYIRGLYAGEVSFVDRWVGRLLQEVADLGLYDDTLVVLLSDHGIPLGDHGSMMKTPDNLYGELVRFTLMVRHPEGPRNKRVDELVQPPDVFATVLDTLGLEKEATAVHGKSIWPVVLGEKEGIRDYAITGYHESFHRCVRDKKWSLIFQPDGRKELYDLEKDPQERHNLIKEYPDKAEEMLSRLGKYYTLRYDRRLRPVRMARQMAQLEYEVTDSAVFRP